MCEELMGIELSLRLLGIIPLVVVTCLMVAGAVTEMIAWRKHNRGSRRRP